MNIYQQRLTDHYRNPRNRGVIERPDFFSGVVNPSCGDEISLTGTIGDGRITAINFQGVGCVISQAAASLLTQQVLALSLAQARALDAEYMRTLVGIELGPTRLKCALLPLDALHAALDQLKTSAKADHA
jgi:nitrogen fixation NifU-like protein